LETSKYITSEIIPEIIKPKILKNILLIYIKKKYRKTYIQ
jgi:hypothetical protein